MEKQAINLVKSDGSSLNVEVQENCATYATIQGFKYAAVALAGSAAVIFGGMKYSPSFRRSLSVSARTALIASPAFGAFFLYGELALNECATKHRHLQRTAKEAAERRKARVKAEAAAAATAATATQ